jgi:hypothetical protein
MPSSTTNSARRHHSVLSRVPGWRPLAKASAAVGAAAAVTAGVTLSMLAGFGIAGLFVLVWAVALIYWRLGNVADRWSSGVAAGPPPPGAVP